MADGQLGTVIQHIRKLAACHTAEHLTDSQLLERFSLQRDQTAFSALLVRHGGLVWNVCRHVLHNEHDAEDALQATFLILARKAPSIHKVGCWLHRVAFLSAMELKRKAARRQAHEKQVTMRTQSNPPSDLAWRELLTVLDQEVQRLPEILREPFVLCCLEAKSKAEAAHQLGWPEGTVSGRLAQARKQLQRRLTRRGISLSAGLTAAGLMTNASKVPAALIEGTVRQVLLFTAGEAAGMGQAVALAEIVIRVMAATKVKALMMMALVASVLATGIGAAAYQGFSHGKPAPALVDQPRLMARADNRPKPAEEKKAGADLYGDPLPEGAISRLGTARLRHGVFVSWLQFSADGQSLLSQGGDGLRIWNARTGQQLHFFPNERGLEQMPHGGSSLSLDGKLLAIPGKSATHLYEVATGKRLKTIESGPVTSARLSPDAKILAVQSEAAPYPFELWDIATGRRLRVGGGDSSFFACLAFTDRGKTLVTAGSRYNLVPPAPDHKIRFWDVASAKEARHFDLGTANPCQIAPSPDGKLLAVICLGDRGTENRIRIWDVAAGKEARQLIPTAKGFTEQTFFSTALVFAPDGQTLYSGGLEGQLCAWNPATGEELRRTGTDFLSPRALAVSPDNKTLAADVVGNAIRLIDVQTGRDRIPDSGHQYSILRMASTPDNRKIVTGDAFHIFVWDTTTGRQLRRIEGDGIWFGELHLVDEGRSLLTVELDKTRQVRTLRMQELESGKEIHRVEWRGKEKEQQGVLDTSEGKILTTSQMGNDVVLRDLNTGKQVGKYSWSDPGVYLHDQALMPNGRTLVTAGSDNLIRLWDLATGREMSKFTFSNDWGNSPIPVGAGNPYFIAKVSPNGRVIVFGSPTSSFIEWHDLPTGYLIRKLESLPDRPNVIVFSPDGRTLAWGGDRAPEVHIVELATGRERRRFIGHKGGVTSLAFSSNGQTLVSGGNDTTAVVWDLTGWLGAKGVRGKPLTPGEMDSCWNDLAGEDATRAYEAIRKLAAASAQAVAHFEKRLTPGRPTDEKIVSQLLADLDSAHFSVREHAAKELDQIGEKSVQACRKALEGRPSIEVRRRLEAILSKQLLEWHTPSPNRLRELRAVEALELIGTPEAVLALKCLAQGAPEARLTQEANLALDRLTKQPVAP